MNKVLIIIACVAALSSGCSEKENTSSNKVKNSGKNAPTAPAAPTPETTPPTTESMESEVTPAEQQTLEDNQRESIEIAENYTDIEYLIERSKHEPVIVFDGFGTTSRPWYSTGTTTPQIRTVPTPSRHHCETAPEVSPAPQYDCACGEECHCGPNCGCGCDFEAIQRKQFSERKRVPGHPRPGFDHRGRTLTTPETTTTEVVAPESTQEPATVSNVTIWGGICQRSDWSFAQSKETRIISFDHKVVMIESYYKVAGTEKTLSDSDAGESCNTDDLIFTVSRTAENPGAQDLHEVRTGDRQFLAFKSASISFSSTIAGKNAAVLFANQASRVRNYVKALVARDAHGTNISDNELERNQRAASKGCRTVAITIQDRTSTWRDNTGTWQAGDFDLSGCRYFQLYTFLQRSGQNTFFPSKRSTYESMTSSYTQGYIFLDGRHPDQISPAMDIDTVFELQ